MTNSALAPVSAGVRAAISAHTHAQDAGDTDALVALYTPEGVLDVAGMGTIAGHESLREAFASWTPTKPQLHLVGNTVITSWSQDTATAVSDVAFMQRGDNGWAVQVVGRYEDVLTKADDTWRFSRRRSTFTT